jgi:hypothetical protein
MNSRMINIRFIRKNEKLAKNDDQMRIWSTDGQTFTVSFRSGDTKKSTVTTLTDSGVFRWMRHTINLLEKDVDPFQFVQLDLPLMPSVLIDAKELNASYNRILDAIEFHLDNWPVLSVVEPASAPVNTGFSAEAEDYSDMPELIPAAASRVTLHIEENQENQENQMYHHYPTRQAVRTHHMFLD